MMKSKILLIFWVMVVVAAAYYGWQSMPQIEFAESQGTAMNHRAEHPSPQAVGAQPFDFSGGGQRKFKAPKTNLFAALYPAPSALPKPKVVEIVRPVVVVPPPVVALVPQVVKPQPQPPPVTKIPMPTFKVLGFLEKNKIVTAFVSLVNEVHLLKQGDKFAEGYRVASLDTDSIVIERIQDSARVTLAVSENTGATVYEGVKGGGAPRQAPIRIFRPQPTNMQNPFIRPNNKTTLPIAHPQIGGAK